MQLPVYKTLKNQLVIEIDYMLSQEQEAVRTLLNIVITEGKTYPHNQPLSPEEFATYWLAGKAFVARRVTSDGQAAENQPPEVLGAFFVKPNFPGRCGHICNAGFIVQPGWRRQGIGLFMAQTMLAIAASQGYEAVMFNLVFANNVASISLWDTLGFETIGRIREAVKLSDGEIVDALMMYRRLN